MWPALGEEAAAVQAARKTADEMEKLTRVAHDRKDEAERKAAAAKHARDEKAKAAEVLWQVPAAASAPTCRRVGD